jgi:hypothetical protein
MRTNIRNDKQPKRACPVEMWIQFLLEQFRQERNENTMKHSYFRNKNRVSNVQKRIDATCVLLKRNSWKGIVGCGSAMNHPSDTTTTKTVPQTSSTEPTNTTTTTNLELLPFDIFVNVVLPYVGSDHYRFKGNFSANFQNQYCTVFPSSDTTMEIGMSQLPLGNLIFLQYLDTLDCLWDTYTCSKAAENGYLEMLQWARANGCPWDEETCSCAARYGHLEILQWARSNGCPWDEETCAYAAMNGHLEILQWARANGCPWGESTCVYAAMNGHLEILQWARANGCPWDEHGHTPTKTVQYKEALYRHDETCATAATTSQDCSKIESGHRSIAGFRWLTRGSGGWFASWCRSPVSSRRRTSAGRRRNQ